MTGAEIAGDDAVPASSLRPAPIDAELLVAVHRALEAVPAPTPHLSGGAAAADETPRGALAGRPMPAGTPEGHGETLHGHLSHRRHG